MPATSSGSSSSPSPTESNGDLAAPTRRFSGGSFGMFLALFGLAWWVGGAAAARARSAATPMDHTDLDPRWRGQVTPVYVERTLRQAAGLPPT